MEKPLVSIVVITFNSAKFVLDTLESAKKQTYKNVELIVSDDCSTDDTVDICEKWIEQNKTRFIRTELITVAKNTGIPSNCNRGLKVANGEWIKIIAGDDALFDDSVENVTNAGVESPEIEILLTQVEVYDSNFQQKFSKGILLTDWQNISALNENADSNVQIEYLLAGNFFPAPGFFIKRSLLNEMGGYDETNKYIEDVPFFLKLLFANKRIYFRPILTLKYRIHSNNISVNKQKVLPLYMKEYSETIVKASEEYGKMKYILNSFWNKIIISLILTLGNKGIICRILNVMRKSFRL